MKHIWRRWADKACCDLHIDVLGMFTMIVNGHQPRDPKDNYLNFGDGGDWGVIPQFARVFSTRIGLRDHPVIPRTWEEARGIGMELGRDLCLSDPKGP